MEEKPVFFVNEGERLVGMLHVPDETPAPIVIFCHGFTGHRIEAHRLFVHAARAFCRHGFLALRFDFRGSGESEGLFQSMTVSREVSDLKAAITWVENLDEVEKGRVGVVGLSLGGVVAILTASQDDRIRAVAAWSAPADLSEVAKGVLGGVGLEEVASRGLPRPSVWLPCRLRLRIRGILYEARCLIGRLEDFASAASDSPRNRRPSGSA